MLKKMIKFNSYEELQKHLNNEIIIRGRISDEPWHHLVGFFEDYPYPYYFELEDGFQIIVYTKEEIDTKNLVEVEGKVIDVKGRSKRPFDSDEEVYSEYHLLIKKIRAVKP